MITQRTLILFISAAIVLVGCKYDKEDELYPSTSNVMINCDTVGLAYTTDLKTFFDTKCAVSGCHRAGQQSPDLTSFGPANAAAGDLYNSASNSSHSGRFTWDACEKAKLSIWCTNPVE